MNPDLRAQLFILDFLRIHGPSTSRKVAKAAAECRLTANIGDIMFKMAVEDKVLARHQGGNRYYVYEIADKDLADGLTGTLRLMAGGSE